MKICVKASILALVASALVACSHHAGDGSSGQSTPSSTSSSAPADQGDKSCADISQGICTREYLPTRCTMGAEEFSSSNPCEARKLAKGFACQNKIPYVESDVKCETKSVVDANAPTDECLAEGERKPCTREYKPQVCRLGGVVAKGSNRCEALNTLRSNVCSKKIAFNLKGTICEADASTKATRSR